MHSQSAFMKQKINKLESQIKKQKVFLNMVIHDMRNPANNIESGMREILRQINESQEINH
jgi:hypothetical protein